MQLSDLFVRECADAGLLPRGYFSVSHDGRVYVYKRRSSGLSVAQCKALVIACFASQPGFTVRGSYPHWEV